MNHLNKSKSPYLLQHKDNPVHWFAWGEDAFEAARKENRPIFLSIGYSTCYWCHMMEKDSFEHQNVADVLNKYFICIKVDREEHPDVDQIYMDAVIALSGNGGWPMSVFLTPDLKPITGATFFWQAQFIQILENIGNLWINEPKKIVEQAQSLTQFLQTKCATPKEEEINADLLKKAFVLYEESFDPRDGGFGHAPKFPHSLNLSLLFRIYQRTQNKTALDISLKTLDAMAHGGIFDHLGGGFHRYATDDSWLTPHFEKMLYDNALLVPAYLEGFEITKKSIYADVARSTLDFVLRELRDSLGGFHCALDAGEADLEGEFYVWKEDELKNILTPQEFKFFKEFYGITPTGNFEHETNILHIPKDQKWDLKKDSLMEASHQKLLEVRQQRKPPHKDDKVLTSWNGLMISAFARGFKILGEKYFLEAAKTCATFIETHLYKDGELLRRYRDGESRFPATLQDYTYLIYGLIDLYSAEPDAHWLAWAQTLQKKCDEILWDEKEGGYFFSDPAAKDLVIQKKEFHDGATPSGNSMAVYNLLRLHTLTGEKEYHEKGERLLKILCAVTKEYPAGYPLTMIAIDYYLGERK